MVRPVDTTQKIAASAFGSVFGSWRFRFYHSFDLPKPAANSLGPGAQLVLQILLPSGSGTRCARCLTSQTSQGSAALASLVKATGREVGFHIFKPEGPWAPAAELRNTYSRKPQKATISESQSPGSTLIPSAHRGVTYASLCAPRPTTSQEPILASPRKPHLCL